MWGGVGREVQEGENICVYIYMCIYIYICVCVYIYICVCIYIADLHNYTMEINTTMESNYALIKKI